MIMFIENHPCTAFHFILYEFRFEKITEFGFTISIGEDRLTIESLSSNEICSVIKVYVWWMVRFSVHRGVPSKLGFQSMLATSHRLPEQVRASECQCWGERCVQKKGALRKRAYTIPKELYLRLMSAQVVANLPLASTSTDEATKSSKPCLSIPASG